MAPLTLERRDLVAQYQAARTGAEIGAALSNLRTPPTLFVVQSGQAGGVPETSATESALLAAAIKRPDRLRDLRHAVRPEHFSRRRFAAIYQVMLDLDARGVTVDYGTLADAGLSVLEVAELDIAPDGAEWPRYARTIREGWARRLLIAAAQSVAEIAWDGAQPIARLKDALDDAHALLAALAPEAASPAETPRNLLATIGGGSDPDEWDF